MHSTHMDHVHYQQYNCYRIWSTVQTSSFPQSMNGVHMTNSQCTFTESQQVLSHPADLMHCYTKSLSMNNAYGQYDDDVIGHCLTSTLFIPPVVMSRCLPSLTSCRTFRADSKMTTSGRGSCTGSGWSCSLRDTGVM